ncbi:Serine/threonine-protein kinase [Phytophthora cactorum]|uniref:Serine/threonine-protein kinase n=4 Tax=Phytophthora cactorum TaxID=29920 RepID=A0A8T1BNM3_9STRA|nr:Serine/threonine-protein kinase [Phytophthora cactorum]KAG2804007.1 Serine/threonine-protein kinase [Phytophthora cactorum]KAG2805324.1 Serine/threonine-protein kinase [Phytophthora cactorum]KAG2842339.1 Serine/threonine-protein kinase [Phytophthora cactorum]KAG2883634.1 Serine/threonine-protein kinase [Phytophthora cactorum]
MQPRVQSLLQPDSILPIASLVHASYFNLTALLWLLPFSNFPPLFIMLRLGRSAASEASNCGGIVVSAIRNSLQLQLDQRGARALQCAYQTQSHRNPEPGAKSERNPLSLAVMGAAALSVGLELQMEGAAQARAAMEPAVQLQRHKWQLFDQIGSGAFGVVRLGMHEESGEVAAVKIVPLENPNDRRSYPALEREISALKLVKALGGHNSIVDLRDVYVEGRKLFLVTELARGGELFEQIVAYGSFPELKARDVAREMASALSFLHRHGLVHKDIKPENILMSARVVDPNASGVFRRGSRHESSSLVKLADFGSAGPASATTNLEDIGTAAYLAPELLTSGVCTSACDMWALGCVLYIMLSGSHPFDLDGMSSDNVVEHRIKSEPITFDFSAWENVSLDAKDLITKLLAKDPTLRLTADQMMQHPWMNTSAEATATAGSLCRPSPLLAGQPIPMSPA